METMINQLRKVSKENGMKFSFEIYEGEGVKEYYFGFKRGKQFALSCRSNNDFKTSVVFLNKNSEWNLPNCFGRGEKKSYSPFITLLYNDNKYIPFDKLIEFIKAN